jgi:hypothetical protein
MRGRTIDDLRVGDHAEVSRRVEPGDIAGLLDTSATSGGRR